MTAPAAVFHPTAVVEEGAAVGPRTRVWAHVHVRAGARVGADCIVGENVFIDVDVRVGDRCKLQNNALVYHGAELEDEVFVGPAACITNDRNPRAANPDGSLKTHADWSVEGVRIRHGASLGAGSIVVAGVTVGRYALVAAGAVVAADVEPHALVAGCPARRIGWVCACGSRLSDALECVSCGRRYVKASVGLEPAQ